MKTTMASTNVSLLIWIISDAYQIGGMEAILRNCGSLFQYIASKGTHNIMLWSTFCSEWQFFCPVWSTGFIIFRFILFIDNCIYLMDVFILTRIILSFQVEVSLICIFIWTNVQHLLRSFTLWWWQSLWYLFWERGGCLVRWTYLMQKTLFLLTGKLCLNISEFFFNHSLLRRPYD